MLNPTAADIWVARELGSRMGRHQLFDLSVQSGIVHGILGGVCFGAVLFLWFFSLRTEDRKAERKFEVAIVASVAAVMLAKLASLSLQWPAPNKYEALTALFPAYITRSPAESSFPSEATAVFGALASGVFGWRRRLGSLLWVAVVLLVAFPRMYVGGHYLTDVLVGAGCGLGGYGLAQLLVRWHHFPVIIRRAGPFECVVTLAVFVYIWQVSVEFREVAWFFNSIHYFLPLNV